MAGTVRFHTKYHGKVHHTASTPGYFDSATDPIAGPGNEFMGDFHLSGCFVAYDVNLPNTSTRICASELAKVIGTTSTIATNSAAWTGGSKWTESGNYTYLSDTNNNVGIGTTSPGVLLHLNGNDPTLKITDATPSDNSATLWLQESNTYGVKLQYNSSSNDFFNIDIIDGGTQTNRFAITRDGKVGIGTTAPGYLLDVVGGNIRVGKTSNGRISCEDNTGDQKVSIDSDGDSYFKGGNVGIGTAAPGAKLSVHSTGVDYKVGRFYDGSYNVSIGRDAIAAYSGDTEVDLYVGRGAKDVILTSGSKLGIGTATPDALLETYHGTDNTKHWRIHRPGSAEFGIGIAGTDLAIANNSSMPPANNYGIYLKFNSGYVGIAKPSPAYTLDVDGDINFTGTLREDGTEFSGGISAGKAIAMAMVFG